jgi:hypothetical protein
LTGGYIEGFPILPYREDNNIARVPPPSGFSMSRLKNYEMIFFSHIGKTKIMLDKQGKLLTKRLRLTFYNLISTLPELTFHDFC